jgi:hypothetical protein
MLRVRRGGILRLPTVETEDKRFKVGEKRGQLMRLISTHRARGEKGMREKEGRNMDGEAGTHQPRRGEHMLGGNGRLPYKEEPAYQQSRA